MDRLKGTQASFFITSAWYKTKSNSETFRHFQKRFFSFLFCVCVEHEKTFYFQFFPGAQKQLVVNLRSHDLLHSVVPSVVLTSKIFHWSFLCMDIEGSNLGDVEHLKKMAARRIFKSKLVCISTTVDITLGFTL
jgi:hypothetical protein